MTHRVAEHGLSRRNNSKKLYGEAYIFETYVHCLLAHVKPPNMSAVRPCAKAVICACRSMYEELRREVYKYRLGVKGTYDGAKLQESLRYMAKVRDSIPGDTYQRLKRNVWKP
jgi:hypothetical protein